MNKRCRNPEVFEACEVCGAPYLLIQSIDALIGAPSGSGFGSYLSTCRCWSCSGCGRQGRENDQRCGCAPCPSCRRPLPPGRECDCEDLPLPF
jgi:hypothetical protein